MAEVRTFFDWLENGKIIEEKVLIYCGLFGVLYYLCPNVAKEGMEIIFNEKYLQEMYLTGQTDKKHRYQPQVVRKYIRVIDIMIDASTYRDFCDTTR